MKCSYVYVLILFFGGLGGYGGTLLASVQVGYKKISPRAAYASSPSNPPMYPRSQLRSAARVSSIVSTVRLTEIDVQLPASKSSGAQFFALSEFDKSTEGLQESLLGVKGALYAKLREVGPPLGLMHTDTFADFSWVECVCFTLFASFLNLWMLTVPIYVRKLWM